MCACVLVWLCASVCVYMGGLSDDVSGSCVLFVCDFLFPLPPSSLVVVLVLLLVLVLVLVLLLLLVVCGMALSP